MQIPDYMIHRISMITLFQDKSLEFGSLNDKIRLLYKCIDEYFKPIESGFISSNTVEFKEYLEKHVGVVEFTTPFAVRVRPGSIRLFIKGKEIYK